MLEELRAAGLPIVSTEQRDAEEYDGEVWRYVVVGE